MLYCYYFPIIIVIIYIYYSTIRFTHFTHRKLFQKASMVPVNMVIQDCVVVFLFLCFFYSLMKGLISVTNCQQTALQLCLITLRTATPASDIIQPKVNKIDQSNPHPQYSEIQSVGTGLSWWTNKSLLEKLPPDLQSCSCHWITNRMGGLFFFAMMLMRMLVRADVWVCVHVQQMYLHTLSLMKVSQCQFICLCVLTSHKLSNIILPCSYHNKVKQNINI